MGALQHLDDRKEMGIFLKEYERSRSVSFEAAQVLSVLAGIKLDTKRKKGERVDMCKAWEDQYEYGKQHGEVKGLAISVRKLMQKQRMSAENAMDFLEIPEEQQEEIIKMLQSA